MECKTFRERFSSFLEEELSPNEEKEIRDHLRGCPECQNELEGFKKTLCWLRSMEEVEVPEGFLSEIYKKMEEREKRGLLGKKFEWRGRSLLQPLKIPIQAVAMVAVVFLVLYLTKMVPVEKIYQRSLEEKATTQSEGKSEEGRLKEHKGDEGKVKEGIPESLRLKEVQPEIPLEDRKVNMGEGKRFDLKEKSKEEVSLTPETKIRPYPSAKKKDREMTDPLESKILAKAGDEESQTPLTESVSKEIALKITDRKKALSQLNEMIKKFGGEIVETQKDFLYASIPLATFLEFEAELKGWDSLKKEERALLSKEGVDQLRRPSVLEPKRLDEKKLPEPILTKDYIRIKIHLLQE